MSLSKNTSKSSPSSIFKQIRYTIQADGVQMIIGFITSILLVRYLGPEGNGVLTKLTYSGNLLLAFASFQFFRGVPFLYQQFGSTPVQKWMSIGITITLISGIFIIILDSSTFHFISWSHNYGFNILLITYVMLALGQKCLESLIQVRLAFNKLWPIQWIASLFKLVSVLLLINIFSSLNSKLRLFFGVSMALIGYIPLLTIAFVYFKPKIKVGIPHQVFLQKAISFARSMWGITLISILINNLPLWSIEHHLGTSALGIYGLALTLSGIPFTLSLGFKKVFLPIIIQRFAANPQICWQLLRIHNTALFIMSVLAAFAGYYLIPSIFGSNFINSATLFPILLVWTCSLGIFTIIQSFYEAENELNRPFYYKLITAVGLGINLFYLPNYFGLTIHSIIYAIWGVLLVILIINDLKKRYNQSILNILIMNAEDWRIFRSFLFK